MKKVAIIGAKGYVGRAYAEMMRKQFEVVEVDPMISTRWEKQQKNANECDLAIVCVPTIENQNGSADVSIVESTIGWLRTPLILIKSTVPPGTTNRLNGNWSSRHIVFSPEYIGEGKYTIPHWKGYAHPTDPSVHNFVIFGGETNDCAEIAEFFKPILGPDAKYAFTDATTAELTKYMENTFFALKVSFANQFYDIAEKFNVNYDELRELWLLDERMSSRLSTLVFKDRRGFGGKCLPKDLSAIIEACKERNYTPELLKAIQSFNFEMQKKNL